MTASWNVNYRAVKGQRMGDRVMVIEKKLQEMGLELPELPAPSGLYVPARRVGNLIYIAGQTPDAHGKRQFVGVVGEDLSIEDGKRSAQVSALNILAVLKAELGDLDKVKQFVQIISYVRCSKGFGDHPAVIDGASELFKNLYGEAGLAARLAIGANELPGGSATEIMAVVEVAG